MNTFQGLSPMQKITYNATFEYADDGINILFPDIPNAISCAFDRDEAIFMAKDVLELVLHGSKISELPKATSFSSAQENVEIVPITIEMEFKDGVLFGQTVVEC